MQGQYLEVTYRAGKALAAYYYLPRGPEDKSARVEKRGVGLLVDLTDDGHPIGIEIAIPELVTVEGVNAILEGYGFAPLSESDLAPLRHAA
jgi:hypothetical protein